MDRNEAIKIVKSHYPANKQMLNEALEFLIPELADSEDEKIRKEIIDFLWKEKIYLQEVHSSVENSPKYRFVMDAIAWLEKQGQVKESSTLQHEGTHEGTSCKENDNSLTREPKFKVGDWVVNNISKDTFLIKSITNGYLTLEDTNGNKYSPCLPPTEDDYHLWSIEDAKEGDVLACENGWTCIFKCLNDNLFSSHCFIDHERWFCEDGGEAHTLDKRICGEIYPATKEQRDLLFQKMREAGYVWNADKKELEKIEQKPTWSEEDEQGYKDVDWCINRALKTCFNENETGTCWFAQRWVNSIKGRLGGGK